MAGEDFRAKLRLDEEDSIVEVLDGGGQRGRRESGRGEVGG